MEGSLMPSDEAFAKVCGISLEQYQREQQARHDLIFSLIVQLHQEANAVESTATTISEDVLLLDAPKQEEEQA